MDCAVVGYRAGRHFDLDVGMTQCERILRHLRDYGSITPAEAMLEYGIMRLAARILDLKAAGYLIAKKMITVTNRYGEDCHVAEYRLVSQSADECAVAAS